MKRIYYLLLSLTLIVTANAQIHQPAEWRTNYRAFATKVNNLVHSRLDASFDYERSQLNGKAWLTLQPHFYKTDSLELDAKGMDIHQVALVQNGKNIPLNYTYVDSTFLRIKLNRTYGKSERYTVYIAYTAKPNELKAKGSSAISDARGLYFINPKGEEKDKPTQIWTQGETEATSVWIPTIDRPNQKSTQLFNLTVPAKYVTLSNGKLTAQKKNTDGTRTDTWSMDQPHAPYLFFLGVGDYAIVKDTYKGKEVSYYVEKEYEKVARKIFGNTPAMMDFFSKKLGIEYPWVKYSQMVARDYVSGAMENTTATLHQESAQQDARELIDGNEWESTIAHELFHHWFGDLVTAESWSNLPVNESFADYSQYLWIEHKYGKDEALYEHFNQMRGYLASGQSNRDLIRFFYDDKEDMFDAVSYNKGGRILHMLRAIVGDDAFFSALNLYLTTHKFGTGNAHKLRLAFEEVTGKDLNWFFNQWFFGNGHPMLDINYQYNAETQTASLIVKQMQPSGKAFQLPLQLDIWHGHEKVRHQFWMENKEDTFQFKVRSKPDLMNLDPERTLLVEKRENKTLAEYIHQYRHSDNYLNRREALAFANSILSTDTLAQQLIKEGLNDAYHRIRSQAISLLGQIKPDAATLKLIENIARTDKKSLVRADAIDFLGLQTDEAYKALFTSAVRDSSYSIAGAALEALSALDSSAALKIANELRNEKSKGRLNAAIGDILILYGDASVYDFVAKSYQQAPLSYTKVQMSISYILFANKLSDAEQVKKVVKDVITFRDLIPAAVRPQTDPPINSALKALADKKEAAGQKELAEYIRSQVPADDQEEDANEDEGEEN